MGEGPRGCAILFQGFQSLGGFALVAHKNWDRDLFLGLFHAFPSAADTKAGVDHERGIREGIDVCVALEELPLLEGAVRPVRREREKTALLSGQEGFFRPDEGIKGGKDADHVSGGFQGPFHAHVVRAEDSARNDEVASLRGHLSDVAGVSFALVAELAAADDGETSSVKERKRALAKEAGGPKSEVMPKPFRVVIVFGAEKVDAFPSPCVHAFSDPIAARKRKEVRASSKPPFVSKDREKGGFGQVISKVSYTPSQ